MDEDQILKLQNKIYDKKSIAINFKVNKIAFIEILEIKVYKLGGYNY